MIYYELQCTGDPSITGIKDGTNQAWFTEDFWQRNPLLEEFMTGRHSGDYVTGIVPDINIELNDLRMSKDAKHTDFISTGALLNGFIVSGKLRELFERFELPSHVYYPVIFHQQDKKSREIREIKDYWWFYFKKDTGERTVDFSKCTFDYVYHAKLSEKPENAVPIHSYEDYINAFLNYPPSLIPTTLVFNKNFDSKLDFWGCKFLSGKDYASDKLLRAMEESKITGYEIRTAEKNRRRSLITGVPFSELIFT